MAEAVDHSHRDIDESKLRTALQGDFDAVVKEQPNESPLDANRLRTQPITNANA